MLAVALRSGGRGHRRKTLATLAWATYILHQISRRRRAKVEQRRLAGAVLLVFFFAGLSVAGCNSVPNISGVWKGTIQASAPGGKDKWQGPAELTLNQKGNTLTGTLVFTHPQAGRVQVPITSGIVGKDTVTFSGQNQFPMGSIEITFHGAVAGASLTGTADMTSRSVLIGPQANTASLNLAKQ
jgi:hypothetical protein